MFSLRSFRAFLPVCFCLALVACQSGGWSQPELACNPASKPVLTRADLWSSTFGDKGSTACLRLTWGAKSSNVDSRYVRIDQDGLVLAYSAQKKDFSAPVQFSIPAAERSAQRSFTLFVFGQDVAPNQRAQHCRDVMGKSGYVCDASEGGDCWFSLAFQRTPAGKGAQSPSIAGACQWRLPPEREKVEEHSDEPDAAPEPPQVAEPGKPEQSPPDATKDASEPIVDNRSETQAQETIPEEPLANERDAPSQREQDPETGAQHLWASSIGSVGDDEISGITSDAQGNLYITGVFTGTVRFGNYSLTSTGRNDIFVAKLDKKGVFLWAIKAGGRLNEIGRQIALDTSGNIYITANSSQGSFGPTTITSSRHPALVIAKLDPSGKWVWAKQAISPDIQTPTGIAIDSQGNVYAAGYFEKNITFGGTLLGAEDGYDGFLCKLNQKGEWQWAKHFGNEKRVSVSGLVIDGQDNLFMSGHFQNTLKFGQHTRTSKGGQDIFVAGLNTQGVFQWVKRAGSTVTDLSFGIALDGAGNPHITGNFQSSADFGQYQLKSKGALDIFVAKLNGKGQFVWASRAGGKSWDDPRSIAVNAQGDVFVAGQFPNTIEFGAKTFTSKGDKDVFVARWDNKGVLLSAQIAGGMKGEYVAGITSNASGNAFVVGKLTGSGMFGTTQLVNKGSNDGFLWKVGWGP